jgi:16S rRNA (guanine527-N7)-methyltransferase
MTSIQSETWQQWSAGLAARFGLILSADTVRAFEVYCRELEIWNANINLISVRSPDEILWRHFADSLAGVAVVDDYLRTKNPPTLRVADIGTGAGFPGIPIKIVRPDIKLTLVESITKKCAFLEHIAEQLSLQGVTIFNERAENLGRDTAHREKYDIVLSRAVSQFAPNLEIALPLVKIGGQALLYKTKKFADDPAAMQQGDRALTILGGRHGGRRCYRIPSGEQEYCILEFEKMAATPPAYPRRPGVPEKKPL